MSQLTKGLVMGQQKEHWPESQKIQVIELTLAGGGGTLVQSINRL